MRCLRLVPRGTVAASCGPHGRRVLRRALLLFRALLLAVGPVAAADHKKRSASFVVGTGWFDANRRRDQAAELRLEYGRLEPRVACAPSRRRSLPGTGSLFVGTGLAYEVRLGAWDVTPTFVPGVYRRGQGRDLGYPLEDRCAAGARPAPGRKDALPWPCPTSSNAGLGSSNPGQESLTISYEWRRDRRAR